MAEGRKLKNYDIYLQKLELYAEASNVKLEWKEQAEEGCYMPSINTIRIDVDLPESIEIASILHELGHNADDMLVNISNSTPLNKAYVAFYKDKHTAKQREIVVACELKAWEIAENIAGILRIKLGKWFFSFKADCIKRYKFD